MKAKRGGRSLAGKNEGRATAGRPEGGRAPGHQTHDWRELRKRAGVSLDKAAAAADVTATTARVFELGGPDEIADAQKRDSLVRVYTSFVHRGRTSEPPRAA